jgi:hypothetical protein
MTLLRRGRTALSSSLSSPVSHSLSSLVSTGSRLLSSFASSSSSSSSSLISSLVRSSSTRLLSPVSSNVTQKRRHHVAAAGSLRTFEDPKQIARLTNNEPTMVSTLLTKEEALKANPKLPKIQQELESQGHQVAFGVDATQLHNTGNTSVAEMMAQAKQAKIDMSTLSVDFLRSGSETPSDDRALIASLVQSARKARVKKLVATHSLAKFNHKAPSEKVWVPEAVDAGFKHLGTTEERRQRVVESVLRGDSVATTPVNTVGVSTFEAPH